MSPRTKAARKGKAAGGHASSSKGDKPPEVKITAAKGRPMLAWVGKKALPMCPPLLLELSRKRAALLAEKLTDEILAPVPHRHFVFSIPRGNGSE